jgi:hypothetical protein
LEEVDEKFVGGLSQVPGIVEELEKFAAADTEVADDLGEVFVLVGKAVEGLDDMDVSVEVVAVAA